MKKNKRNRKKINRLECMLEMPKEISTNESKLTILGFNEILIENYKNILEYEEIYIRINTHIGVIDITGLSLSLNQMTEEDIIVTGKIEKIEFESITDEE